MMAWHSRSIAFGVALGVIGFLYFISSPWLVWHSASAEKNRLFVFSAAIPRELVGSQTQYFTTLPQRWRYVFTHRSRAAWRAAAWAMLAQELPLQPAVLAADNRWFDTPMLIMATQSGTTLRVMASPVQRNEPRHSARAIAAALSANAPLHVEIPGAVLRTLPPTLQEAWNSLLHTHLGFTATKPDILAALVQHKRVVITVDKQASAVGISTADPAEAERWEETAREWVVAEDRFRRPQTQAFRLPDGTLGREIVAGLPGSVWADERSDNCFVPLPDKPALWFCSKDMNHVLASTIWTSHESELATGVEWQVALGQEFLQALPRIAGISAQGTTTEAAGVLVLQAR